MRPPDPTTYGVGEGVFRFDTQGADLYVDLSARRHAGPLPVVLELGCRFAHIQFFWVDGEGEQYRGQWQGGRVTTDKREKQV